MTTYNTGNPIPSADARDRFDNSQTFDEVVNGGLTYYTNRVGNNVLSFKGMADMFNAAQLERTNEYTADKQARDTEFAQDQAEREAAFDQFLEGAGWSSLGAYAAGISIVSHTQTVDYLGQPYSLKPSIPASLDAPYVTTGNWAVEGVNFKLVGDNSLRQDLAADGGAFTIGNNVASVDSIATLLALQPGQRKAGLVYNVEAYYAGTGVGGNPWKWLPSSTKSPTYGSVLQVPGVTTGRFEVIKLTKTYTASEFGVRGSNTGVDNRLRLTALYRDCYGSACTVHLMDEDCSVDASQPVIVPADTKTIGGRGWIIPVFELPQPTRASANNPDGTRNCYGGIFTSGDPVTGLIWMGGMNNIYMGTIRFIGVKIKNINNLETAAGYTLHGIFCNGGVVIYVDCTIDGMPNNGYVTSFYREAHYIRCKGRRNGLLAAGGSAGGAKNGISNTSTYTVTTFVYPEEDRSRIVTVTNCEFMYNKDEGVQYSCCPFVLLQGNDLKFNGDRAIEGDSAYTQTSKTRENDQVHVYNNDCRGVPGSTRYSATFTDGFNKDVYLGGNVFGGCTGVVVSALCSSFGSVTFTSRNRFELDANGLTNGCHAMYLNAGLIDLQAGGTVTGLHNRSADVLDASLLVANNELVGGGTVLIGNFNSDVTFSRAVSARSKSKVEINRVDCPTGRAFSLIKLLGDMASVEISDCDGAINSRGLSSDGIVNFIGLDTYVLDRLILKGNMHTVSAATRYPVNGTAPAGQILRLFSSGNYWDDYTFNGGAKRLTSVAGLAVKSSVLDLPVLT